MDKEKLLEYVIERELAISVSEIESGKLDRYIDNGLSLLIMCLNGGHRGPLAAFKLVTEYQTPALYVLGGLVRLASKLQKSDSPENILDPLNRLNHVAVIMGSDEAHPYNRDTLQKIRTHKIHQNIPMFLHSIGKL